MMKARLCFGLLAGVLACSASAATYYVSPTGDESNPTAGFATGYKRIEAAIAAAEGGGTVLLDRATHTLTNNKELVINKAITVCGVGTKEETIIDGVNGKDNSWKISAAGGVYHTFSMIHMGSNYSGSLGLNVIAATVISNCVFRENGNTYSGNARYPVNLSAKGGLITHCWITNNIAPNNPGVYIGSGAVMENCYIADNVNKGSSSSWYAVVDLGECTMRNCTIVNNRSANQVVRYTNGKSKVYNNVIWGNMYYKSADVNNWTSTVDSLANWKNNVTTPLAGSAEDGNSAEDPLFREDRMHWSLGSPCRGAGLNTSDWPAPAIDLESAARPDPPSIGAFEYVASTKFTANVVASSTMATQPDTITLSVSVDGSYAGPLSFAWDLDGDGSVDATTPTVVLSDIAVYSPSVVVTDANGKTTTAKHPNQLVIFSASGEMYVTSKPNPDSRPPYATWKTAATNLDDAITYAVANSVISFDEGTHVLRSTVELAKPLTLKSTNGCEKTFLANSRNDKQLFITRGSDRIVIDGFTVANGKFVNYAKGAIIQLAGKTTLRNCRFLRNGVCGHGAIECTESVDVVIENCMFVGNYTPGTQGPSTVKLSGTSPVMRNCLFLCNTNSLPKPDYSYRAGGVYIASGSATVLNCTVVSNVSYNVGDGGIYNYSNGSVKNCIVCGNLRRVADEASESGYSFVPSNDITGGSGKVSYSCLFPSTGDYAGYIGVVTADPLLAADWTLRVASPCRNAGDDGAWTKDDVDLAGQKRIFGRHVDMGCYELQQGGGMKILVR